MNSGDDCVTFLWTDELAAGTRRVLFEWGNDPFQSSTWGLQWRDKDHHLLIYENSELGSHVGLVREVVRVGGKRVAVAGLGNVITVPEFQKRGLAKRGISEAIRMAAEEWNVGHGLLFCFPHLRSFYEGLGWVAREDRVWVLQPGGRISLPIFSMVQAWKGEEWPCGEIEVEGLPW